MAKIKYKNQEMEVQDKSPIRPVVEKLGVPFSCKNGTCGTCIVEVKKGQENLNDLNQAEKDLGMDRNYRLSCQCCINHGEVEIDF